MYNSQDITLQAQTVDELIKYFGFKPLTPAKLETAIEADLKENSDKNVCALFVSDEKAELFATKSVATAKGVIERKQGKAWTLNEYVRGMLYAMLSNQRKWEPIEEHTSEIDELFGDFENLKWIKSQKPDYFIAGIKNLTCGNRAISAQMNALKYDIEVLERVASDHGSVDQYIKQKVQSHQEIELINSFASGKGKYKLKGLGIALVCEFLKNFGVNICKPDSHVLQFVGANRMCWINRILKQDKEKDVLDTIQIFMDLSASTGYSAPFLDTLVWNLCHDDKGKGELGICGAKPDCVRCIVSNCINQSKK